MHGLGLGENSEGSSMLSVHNFAGMLLQTAPSSGHSGPYMKQSLLFFKNRDAKRTVRVPNGTCVGG